MSAHDRARLRSGASCPPTRLDEAVEEHALDPHVIVEPLHVPHAQRRRPRRASAASARSASRAACASHRSSRRSRGSRCNRRSASRRLARRRPLWRLARHVGRIGDVLARADRHSGRCVVADEPRAGQIAMIDRLLEPVTSVRREAVRAPTRRRRYVIAAVAVDEQADVRPDRLAAPLRPAPGRRRGRARPSSSRRACRHAAQPCELRGERPLVVRREAAAAIDRNCLAHGAEQIAQRHARAGAR